MTEQKNYIFYDLETNGLDYYTTGIMQISLIDIDGNVLLNKYTYPFDNRIDGFAIHGIDQQKLENNNASTTIDMLVMLKKIIREKYGRQYIYLVAYNNFGYDQVILENNFKICGIKMPQNWYFTDLFPIVKELYPTIKPNFKLKTVFELLCGVDENINFHCSLGDTTCLFRLFKLLENNKSIFEKYTRNALSNSAIFDNEIYLLNGYVKSMSFEEKGLNTIGSIVNIYRNCINNDEFNYILKSRYNIYSDYYIKNITKSIESIYYFHK